MKNNKSSIAALGLIATMVWCNSLLAQVTFTNVTQSAKIQSPSGAPSYNSMWIDLDNDDFLDIYIARGNAASHLQPELYRNQKNGTFKNLSATAFGNRLPAYNGHICWGDYDNDGFIDLYENHFDGSDNRLWHNEGNLTFTDKSPITINTGGYSVGDVWTDFNLDGFIDLVVSTQAGQGTFEIKNLGGQKFEQVNLFFNLGQGHLTLAPDLNLDGSPDFYFGNIHSLDQAFVSSKGGYVAIDNSFIDQNRFNDGFMTAAFGDVNNDGYPDLLYGQNDHLFLLLNDSGRSFRDITAASKLILTPGVYRSSYIQDIDNDGNLDVILFEFSGITEIWYGDKNGSYKKTTPTFPTQSELESVLSWTDYDNNGFLDLLVVTPNFTNLYHNDGNANRWLNVTLQGHKANTKGIGARVIAYSEGRMQSREIGFTQGTLGYSPLLAHFGFGPATCYNSPFIDSVVIIWQPGGKQVIKNVRYNELAVIDQDSGIVRTIEKPVTGSYGFASPYFMAAKSVYADTIVEIPMTMRIPHNFVLDSIDCYEITFNIQYNSDLIDITPTKVALRYSPPAGWIYKTSAMMKDSLSITITSSKGVKLKDSIDLGSLRFDTYKAKARSTFISLNDLIVRSKNNEYKFCRNYEGDFFGEVFVIERPSGVADEKITSLDLSISPNPSSGNLVTARFTSKEISSAEISVFDVLGKEVYRYKGEGSAGKIGIQNFSIPVSQLSGGTYLLRLNSSGQVITKKFTVVK